MNEIIKGAKILIVDDEQLYLNILFNYLNNMGARVFLADNGNDAIHMVKDKKPDLILLDVMMPEMDGYEVCKKLTDNEETGDIPVIFLTALSSTNDVLKGFGVGGMDYLTKPVQYQELMARISIRLKMHYIEKTLRYHLKIEELATSISTSFINFTYSELDKKIHSALKTIGEFFCVDQCYIYIFSDDLTEIEKIYEWYSDESEPKTQNLTGLAIKQYHWVIEKLKKFETIYIPSIEGLSEEAKFEKELWQKQNIKSILAFPMEFNKSLTGFFGMSCIKKEKSWKEEDIKILKMLGEIFLNVFRHKWAEEEHREIEKQLRRAEKFESLGIMAGGIAHNFNNILSGALGYAELAINTLSEKSLVRRNLEKIIYSVGRAADITRQILAYAGGDRFVMCVEKINLTRIVKETIELVEVSVGKKIALSYELTEDLPLIEGDVSQISQIIINLIMNASEALDNKEGLISVRTGKMNHDESYLAESLLIDYKPSDLYAYLEVEDTGCGIQEEVKYKIFDPFFTTKFTGRGLGLAAVQGIVRSHKGTIKVESEPGKGTAIKVLFPAIS